MIDLSNNNKAAAFRTVYASGHRRVYLKLTEGLNFVDGKHDAFRRAAISAGLKVGEYHFAHPHLNKAKDEAEFFCLHLPKLRPGQALRPCLDLEDGAPSEAVAQWAVDWVFHVSRTTGHTVVLYSNPSYLSGCRFRRPTGPLWLAAYGRNDGKEHPVTIPAPWKHAAAHQYTSRGNVPGVLGLCDVSRVWRPRQLDVHRFFR